MNNLKKKILIQFVQYNIMLYGFCLNLHKLYTSHTTDLTLPHTYLLFEIQINIQIPNT